MLSYAVATGVPSQPSKVYFAAAAAGARGGLLEAVGAAELLAEPLDAAGGVDELLLAGEERVAVRSRCRRRASAGVLRVVNVLPQAQ